MEKKLRDEIVNELKSGLVYKTDVDYGKLRQTFQNIHVEIKAIHKTAVQSIGRVKQEAHAKLVKELMPKSNAAVILQSEGPKNE